MNKTVLLWVGCLLLSCGEKMVEKPKNLIPKDTMVLILYDLVVLSAAESSFKSIVDSCGIETMEFLYQKYRIDSTRLVQSDRYYASLPLEYQFLYNEVAGKIDQKIKALEAATLKKEP